MANYDLCTGVRTDALEVDFSPTGAAYTAFHKAQWAISRNGAALAQVTGARLTYANGMEMVRTIRADRKVEGVDPGIARATGQITARFADTALLTQAQNNGPAEFAFSYAVGRVLAKLLHKECLSRCALKVSTSLNRGRSVAGLRCGERVIESAHGAPRIRLRPRARRCSSRSPDPGRRSWAVRAAGVGSALRTSRSYTST